MLPAPYFRLIRCRRQRCTRPIRRGAILNEKKASRETDLDRLSRLKALSWLSPSELKLQVSALSLSNYKRHALILRDVALAQGAHILLAGIARITCRNARNERVTVALLAPGPIPDFPALPLSNCAHRDRCVNLALRMVLVGDVGSIDSHRENWPLRAAKRIRK